MAILIFAILAVVLAALLVFAIDYLPLPTPFSGILKFLVILLAIVAIGHRAGLF